MSTDPTGFGRDWPGAAVAAVCAGLALYVLQASAAFTQFGAIFPRTIAIVMLILAAALLFRALAAPRATTAPAETNLWRPLALVGVVALWMALIRLAGFYAASVLGFAAAGVLARFTPWTRNPLLLHLAVSVIFVTAFYLLFAYGLRVRLS